MENKPYRFPRLRRSANPPKGDQRLLLKGLERSGLFPRAVTDSQKKKLREDGVSKIAVSYIQFEHEPVKHQPPKRGRPFVQGGQIESKRRRR